MRSIGFAWKLSSQWTSVVDVRKTYLHTDVVGELAIFNISGNKYRLATYINYRTGKVYIRHVMTHEEYRRKDWKKSVPCIPGTQSGFSGLRDIPNFTRPPKARCGLNHGHRRHAN